VEGSFSKIANDAIRVADRRNEIAHGIVRPLQWIQSMVPEYADLRGDDSNALLYEEELDEKNTGPNTSTQ
jgi:hypothetical protein